MSVAIPAWNDHFYLEAAFLSGAIEECYSVLNDAERMQSNGVFPYNYRGMFYARKGAVVVKYKQSPRIDISQKDFMAIFSSEDLY